jgi:hypothetical protein
VAQPVKLTQVALRYRDGRMIQYEIPRLDPGVLEQAGFTAYRISLDHDDGTRIDGALWSQDPPSLADYLNAAILLFGTEPGSLSWDLSQPASGL